MTNLAFKLLYTLPKNLFMNIHIPKSSYLSLHATPQVGHRAQVAWAQNFASSDHFCGMRDASDILFEHILITMTNSGSKFNHIQLWYKVTYAKIYKCQFVWICYHYLANHADNRIIWSARWHGTHTHNLTQIPHHNHTPLLTHPPLTHTLPPGKWQSQQDKVKFWI